MPDNTFDDMVNKEKKLLDLSYKQSKANKQERLDNEEKRKTIMYQVWYIPRMEDELPIASFNNIESAIELMTKIKQERPKAFPHHYIWDVNKKEKYDKHS